MKIILKPGETLVVSFEGTQGDYLIDYANNEVREGFQCSANLPDDQGRFGLIHRVSIGSQHGGHTDASYEEDPTAVSRNKLLLRLDKIHMKSALPLPVYKILNEAGFKTLKEIYLQFDGLTSIKRFGRARKETVRRVLNKHGARL